MRIDDFLSTVGIIPRRTEAKRLADSGMIEVNGRAAKASYQIKPDDVIRIKGGKPVVLSVIAIPHGSVAKTARDHFFRILPPTSAQ